MDISDLTLDQLCAPLLRNLEIKHVVTEESPIFNVTIKHNDRSFDVSDQQYQSELRKLITEYPNISQTYFYLARPYVVSGQYDVALGILFEGVERAGDKGDLAYYIGVNYLLQHEIQSVGWHMQACLLATTIPFAYKNLAEVALATGMEILYWRLRNAGDVIDKTHIPGYEEAIRQAAEASPQTKTKIGELLKIFEEEMNAYLPSHRDVPTDANAREHFLLDEQHYLLEANVRLLSREGMRNSTYVQLD
jgi:tetratricopeptide (TPR) repeat protein